MILPGKTIGILGGGQLGRMTGQAARSLGYGFVVFEPQDNSPAGQVADLEINASYEDETALQRFADNVDIITYEFENVSAKALQFLSSRKTVFPKAECLYICQNREREKKFLQRKNFPCAPFEIIESAEDLEKAIEKIGRPSVLKTADFGYDGKGQMKIKDEPYEAERIWNCFGLGRAVLEKWMDFEMEISVMVAIGSNGGTCSFPVSENIHTNHILDYSLAPARIDSNIRKDAESLAKEIASTLGIVGLLGVELFVLKDGSLAVNELAPRPHNSGHYTIDACVTSQFEQFVRAVCGLPLGSVGQHKPVAMVNILGDAWSGKEPGFSELLKSDDVKLHLYGKAEPRPGRKMGHFCVFGEDTSDAFERAKKLKATV